MHLLLIFLKQQNIINRRFIKSNNDYVVPIFLPSTLYIYHYTCILFIINYIIILPAICSFLSNSFVQSANIFIVSAQFFSIIYLLLLLLRHIGSPLQFQVILNNLYHFTHLSPFNMVTTIRDISCHSTNNSTNSCYLKFLSDVKGFFNLKRL